MQRNNYTKWLRGNVIRALCAAILTFNHRLSRAVSRNGMFQRIVAWIHHPVILAGARLLFIGSVSLAIVLTLFVIQAIEGRWTWVVHIDDHLARHIAQLPAEFLPIPIAFLLWVRLMERSGEKFTLFFSPIFCVISVGALVATQKLAGNPDFRQDAFAVSIITGLFVFVSLRECMKRAIRDIRPATVAVIAGSAACDYYWLMRTLWEHIGSWTTHTAAFILHKFDREIGPWVAVMRPHRVLKNAHFIAVWTRVRIPHDFIISSPYFKIQINPGCNGLEGIFLFIFMLSALLLYDWALFKYRRISLLYLFGIVYMFFFNALRIVVIFTIGYWAYRPDAWGWVHSLQGVPIDMFHSYEGWLFYWFAFAVVAFWLYKTGIRHRQKAAE